MGNNYFPFDKDVARAAVLYVLQALGGSVEANRLGAILYFADQKHLVKYGRSIFGGRYIKTDFGAMPEFLYKILQ